MRSEVSSHLASFPPKGRGSEEKTRETSPWLRLEGWSIASQPPSTHSTMHNDMKTRYPGEDHVNYVLKHPFMHRNEEKH